MKEILMLYHHAISLKPFLTYCTISSTVWEAEMWFMPLKLACWLWCWVYQFWWKTRRVLHTVWFPSVHNPWLTLSLENRIVWAMWVSSVPLCILFIFQIASLTDRFMGQLTLARFRGDTAFALIARLISTFAGGIVGLVMWYEPIYLTQDLWWPVPNI